MAIRRAAVLMRTTGLLVFVPVGMASAAPGSGGCHDFGLSVAVLAIDLGPQFGANASFVASEVGPQVFPNLVVKPEQDAACPD